MAITHIHGLTSDVSFLKLDGWNDWGSVALIVNDQSTPWNTHAPGLGDQNVLEMNPGKANENFIRTYGDYDDTGNLTLSFAIKLGQRDLHLNQNARHDILKGFDNNLANQVFAFYYESAGEDSNILAIEDAVGTKYTLDSGPFTANQWLEIDIVWKHGNDAPFRLWINKVLSDTASGMDLFTTAGDVGYSWHGQLDTTDPPTGGNMWLSYFAHETSSSSNFTQAWRKDRFLLLGKYGPYGALVQRNGTSTPGDDLTGIGQFIERLSDGLLTSSAQYRPVAFDELSGAWACDIDVDRMGPAGRFPTGVNPWGCAFDWVYSFGTKGGADSSPRLLSGRGNSDLDSFTIRDNNPPRGNALHFMDIMVPGDSEFPDIDDFAMIGFGSVASGAALGTMSVQEAQCVYITEIVEGTTPAPSQINLKGKSGLLGDLHLGP